MPPVEPLYAQLGLLLREERKRRRVTQAVVAERVGLPRSAVSNIEQGRQRLYFHTFLQFAAAIDADPSDLLRALRHIARELRFDNVASDTPGMPFTPSDENFVRALVEPDASYRP